MKILAVLPRLTERGWQGEVLTLAKMFGWRWWHDRATNFPRACPKCKAPLKVARNDPGWPDLFMVRGDTLIVAELKSDRGKTTDSQNDWLSAFSRVRRIKVFTWRPSDAQAVSDQLR